MHSTSDNIEIMINDEADEVIKEVFDQVKIDINIICNQSKVASLSLFSVLVLCDKINPNRGGTYIDPPDWIKSKKATINPINTKDSKYFQYAVTVALNYQEIKKNPQRITKIKLFINKYSWKGINFPSE